MIAVIGAGALGTALAIQIHRAGNQAALLATEYDEPVVDAYRRGDPHPAIGVPFPPAPLHARDDWPAALGDADVIVLAVSTTGLIGTVADAKPHAHADATWAVGTKGWDERTLRSASAVVADALGDEKHVVALVGPSLAAELALGVPTALVCASANRAEAMHVAGQLSSESFSTFVSADVGGVEVSAAPKNVIAIGM